MKISFSRPLLMFSSLLISVCLWFYVLNSEPVEVDKKIQLILIPPAGQAVSAIVPEFIDIKLTGSRAFIQKINFKEQKVIVDLKDFMTKDKTFAVTFNSSMTTLPFGVNIVSMKPAQVMLSLDREIKKYVPVRTKLVSKVGKDLKLVSKKHTPEKLFISGPYELLKNVGQLSTTPIDLSTLEGEGVIKVSLEPVDRRVAIKDKQPISFFYKVKPNKANMTLKKVKIRFLTTRGRFKSSHSLVSLDVLVSGDDSKSIKKTDIKVIADIPDRGRGSVKVKLRAEVPEGVHLLKIHPETIKVRLR